MPSFISPLLAIVSFSSPNAGGWWRWLSGPTTIGAVAKLKPRHCHHGHEREPSSPFGRKATNPVNHLYTETYVHAHACGFFCRVGPDISSTGFAGAGACFAMKRQILFLPFEVDAREKETLPALGPGGTSRSYPPESPTNAPIITCTTLTSPYQSWATFSLQWVEVSCFLFAIQIHSSAVIGFLFPIYIKFNFNYICTYPYICVSCICFAMYNSVTQVFFMGRWYG